MDEKWALLSLQAAVECLDNIGIENMDRVELDLMEIAIRTAYRQLSGEDE
jgi:hypothetical protein